jgi:hypothetical protein
MQTNLEKLKEFLGQKAIANEVLCHVFDVNLDSLNEAQAFYVKNEVERLLKLKFDQEKFEEISAQSGWTEEEIAMTRLENDLKTGLCDMRGAYVSI